MKKMVSILLILVLLVSMCSNALADTIRLPEKITIISEEAFYGDKKMDVVVLPSNVEVIENRSFANSSISKIYIPSTVSSIALDSFSGTNVKFLCPAGSYAADFAKQNQISWEDCGDFYMQPFISIIEELQEEGFFNEGFTSSQIEILSTEGITNQEELSFINELNTHAQNANEAMNSFSQGIEEVSASFSDFFDQNSDNSYTESNGLVSVSMGSMKLEMPSNLYNSLSANTVVKKSDEAVKDNKYILLIDGKKYEISCAGNILRFQQASSTKAKNLQTNSTSKGVSAGLLDTLEKKLDDMDIQNQVCLGHIDRLLSNAEAMVKKHESWLRDYQKGIASGKYTEHGSAYQKVLNDYHNAQKSLETVKKISVAYQSLNIGIQIKNGRQLAKNWEKVNEIKGHKHPTEEDINTMAKYYTEELTKDIAYLQIMYGVNAFTIVGEITSALFTIGALLCSMGGINVPADLAAGGGVLLIIASIGVGLLADYLSESTLRHLLSMDSKLHTYVKGYVYDKITKKPLQYVTVTCDENTTVTNSAGYYKINIYKGDTKLVFKRDGYISQSLEAEYKEGTQTFPSVYLVGNLTGLPVPSRIIIHSLSIEDFDETLLSDHNGNVYNNIPEFASLGIRAHIQLNDNGWLAVETTIGDFFLLAIYKGETVSKIECMNTNKEYYITYDLNRNPTDVMYWNGGKCWFWNFGEHVWNWWDGNGEKYSADLDVGLDTSLAPFPNLIYTDEVNLYIN